MEIFEERSNATGTVYGDGDGEMSVSKSLPIGEQQEYEYKYERQDSQQTATYEELEESARSGL